MHYFRVDIEGVEACLFSTKYYECWDDESLHFPTLEAVRKYLAEMYKGKRRQKMYIGEGKHIGWIYSYRVDHGTWRTNRQDWIKVHEVEEEVAIP